MSCILCPVSIAALRWTVLLNTDYPVPKTADIQQWLFVFTLLAFFLLPCSHVFFPDSIRPYVLRNFMLQIAYSIRPYVLWNFMLRIADSIQPYVLRKFMLQIADMHVSTPCRRYMNYKNDVVCANNSDACHFANEKMLFHGTDRNTTVGINRQGFNRRYSNSDARLGARRESALIRIPCRTLCVYALCLVPAQTVANQDFSFVNF